MFENIKFHNVGNATVFDGATEEISKSYFKIQTNCQIYINNCIFSNLFVQIESLVYHLKNVDFNDSLLCVHSSNESTMRNCCFQTSAPISTNIKPRVLCEGSGTIKIHDIHHNYIDPSITMFAKKIKIIFYLHYSI